MRDRKKEWFYRLLVLPGLLNVILFCYVPMFGIIIAFQRFMPARGIFGSPFVGLANFQYMFELPNVGQVFFNTVLIACSKIILTTVVSIAFALLLSEATSAWFKRIVQTFVYLPHFLSWVILACIFTQMLSLNGIVNQLIKNLGMEPIQFLINGTWMRIIIIITDVWQDFGYGSIIYLAAILAINPNLYEAAIIDGANRLQRIFYITIPCIAPTIVLLATLKLGQVLNAGFGQILNMYNPLVYSSIDIIDTYVYRIGIINMQYGFSTAVGLLKSVIGFVLIVLSHYLAGRFANYRIF